MHQVRKVRRVVKKNPTPTPCACSCQCEILQGEIMMAAEVWDEGAGDWSLQCFVNSDHLVRILLITDEDSWADLVEEVAFEEPPHWRKGPDDVDED